MLEFLVSAWRSGLRGRSFQAVLLFGVLLIGAAFLAGFFSPRQPKTVTLDVGLSVTRFGLLLLALFWVHELVAREIERRTVLFSLAYPVPRSHYVVGRFLGLSILLAVATLIFGLLLLIAVLAAGRGFDQEFAVLLGTPFWATMFAIWLDVSVVTAFALWIASLSTVVVLPIALGAAFAIAGRTLGAVLDYLARGADNQPELVARFDPLLQGVSLVVPDLSRLDWRPWPMYGVQPAADVLLWSVGSALAYLVAMLCLASYSFSRREFT